MADVIRFWLKLRPPPSVRRKRRSPSSSAAIAPFPYSRRRHLVEQHACAMRGMSDEECEVYITKVLEQVCEDMGRFGLDCQANDAIDDFADAIGKELHGPSFSLRKDSAS